ncbi:MAG: hypothetical protein JWM86_2421 [Thermoleophilia bacterium]|nr:hypothetical protein [Thermoleophilia bacterium]
MTSVILSRHLVALTSALVLLLPAAAAQAEGEHVHPQPVAPTPGDVRFMPGTVGPTVFRGTAATVTIPDGPGFGGERGRMQNSGDRRKNNYSVTDANFNNVLGLLNAHPDTGAPLTYVQHIQTYAAAGYIETFAPDAYAHMTMHQNAGQGTVLGASAYLMGLVQRADPAAHGLTPEAIPAKLPGTDMEARLYVRSTKDATGQQWARMHHAQTAPAVYRMLTAAGLNPTTALILASDDGISGAGRLNGVNEQDGASDGFNSGERATWALAAQVAIQTGIPAVGHLMHGHDHAGIDVSAMTRPKINTKIGFVADDRSASDARAAAIQRVLSDGTVASAATAAADQDLTVRNSAYLDNTTRVKVDMDGFDYLVPVGTERTIKVTVGNDGPHAATDVMLDLHPTANLQVVSMTGPASVHCTTAHCHIGTLAPDWNDSKVELAVTVRFASFGKSTLRAALTTSSKAVAKELSETQEHAAKTASRASGGMAARGTGWRASTCGTRLGTACKVRQVFGFNHLGTVRPASEGNDGRWVKSTYYQLVGKRWVRRFDRSGQVDALGRVRIRADRWSKLRPGVWRVRIEADATWLLGATQSRYTYLRVS